MSNNRKGVRGGTVRTDQPPLCRSYRHARYVQGAAESQRILVCQEVSDVFNAPMPFEAYECSDYDDKRIPSKADLYEIAWVLRTDPRSKGAWGFVRPEKRKKELEREGGLQAAPWDSAGAEDGKTG